MITFDQTGYQVNGKDRYLISGEFHYFRVPQSDWKRRMELFLKSGGNCLATYIPWIIHEETEGNIVFDDCPQRNLSEFLETAKDAGLDVIVRPGPYVYSELVNAGIPEWLIDEHPEILAKDINGNPIRDYAVSYLHPVFLEKARTYYRKVTEIIKPYLSGNGGPICMVQVDNELSGIHLWSSSMDYNRETIGIGRKEGRYPSFLKNRYSDIQQLNRTYNTDYKSFEEVLPIANIDKNNKAQCLRVKDYSDFYQQMMADYLGLLTSWLREDGINVPVCHNSGTPVMNCLFEKTVKQFNERKEKFLLGSDHYYTLGQNWSENNPSPKYAIRMMLSADTLRNLGMPPMAMELPAGSCSDTPPMLPNDMLAAYMTNAAMGMKAFNYYIFTGGPNYAHTGESCEIYDFSAPVDADGQIRQDKYDVLVKFSDFLKKHRWMQRSKRFASVQIGFEWNTLKSRDYDLNDLIFKGEDADRYISQSLIYPLMCSKYPCEMIELHGELDISRPLIIPSPSMMSSDIQKKILEFIVEGGRVLLLPVVPEKDLEYNDCHILSELLKGISSSHNEKLSPYILIKETGTKVYSVKGKTVFEINDDCNPLISDAQGSVLSFEKKYGKGKAIFFGGDYLFTTFPQAEMLDYLLSELNAESAVEHDNRNVFTALWKKDENSGTIFLMNLYSSPQTTEIRFKDHMIGEYELDPMEVKTIDYSL